MNVSCIGGGAGRFYSAILIKSLGEDDAGLWRVHAYQYEQDHATFIVECTRETFERSGLAVHDPGAAHYSIGSGTKLAMEDAIAAS